jgi:serine/threonine protein kinase
MSEEFMAFTVEDFCGLLIRSRLHTVEAVKTLFSRWQHVGRHPDSLDEFRSWLVARNYLTEYQADLIHRGHGDSFFLNNYCILQRVAKGSMAGVYKAVSPKGQVVALKVLPPSRSRDPELWARFQREIRLAMKLQHPSVVKTFDFGKVNSLYFLVMEYLDGVNLQGILEQRKRLPVGEVARIGYLAALGLQHIFECGMVHRDLKPGNLMLTPAPLALENTLLSAVKILDIGLGRALFDSQSKDVIDVVTNEGTILGTPDYLAPEQARDPSRVDIRADLYSLGCTLYHAATGDAPFADDNLVRQILRHANQPPRPLREVDASIPERFEQIILRLLEKDPRRRFQTPAEAAQALCDCL